MAHPKPSAKNAAGEISDSERFTRFVRGIINVPGAEVRQKIETEKETHANKRRAKTSSASRASNAKD
jgi:hypothetical protein